MSGSIPNENILQLINTVVSLLNEADIPYWIGRGVLGDFLVNGELRCQHSDVDFHVWKKDEEKLKEKLIPKYEEEGFESVKEDHKLAFIKPKYILEFVYLSDDTKPGFVYHTSCNKKKACPKYCFSETENETIRIGQHNIPRPSDIEEYFSHIYKNNQWREKYSKC